MNDYSELANLVSRIIERDPRAEEELVRRYRDGIFHIIYQIVCNYTMAEDLRQETLIKAIEKIRHGDVREPERLSGFVRGIAKYIALDYVRKIRSAMKSEDVGAAEHLADPAPDPYEQVLRKEKAEIVRKIISEMRVQRDRDILLRYYILEEDKDAICAALGLSREDLSRIISRARQRYKELYQKLAGKLR